MARIALLSRIPSGASAVRASKSSHCHGTGECPRGAGIETIERPPVRRAGERQCSGFRRTHLPRLAARIAPSSSTQIITVTTLDLRPPSLRHRRSARGGP